MNRECPACPGLTWTLPSEAGDWLAHIRSAEHDAAAASPEGRARIPQFWAERDAEEAAERAASAGMLF